MQSKLGDENHCRVSTASNVISVLWLMKQRTISFSSAPHPNPIHSRLPLTSQVASLVVSLVSIRCPMKIPSQHFYRFILPLLLEHLEAPQRCHVPILGGWRPRSQVPRLQMACKEDARLWSCWLPCKVRIVADAWSLCLFHLYIIYVQHEHPVSLPMLTLISRRRRKVGLRALLKQTH